MILGKVISRVVASHRSDRLPPHQLLLVEPLPNFGLQDQPIVALDSVQAGPGDTVLILQEGTGAREALRPKDPHAPIPAQAVIVGVVDMIQI